MEIRTDSISNLQSLISLYRGDLLPDFYDDWIPPLREKYRELYLNALLARMQHARASSDYAQVIELGRRALVTDPANETAHQHLIFALAAQGERTEVQAKKMLRPYVRPSRFPKTSKVFFL